MSPRTKSQNQALREETRQQILMTALQAFAEKGFRSASMSYIAKEAGISKGLSYHYFGSKEEILLGILDLLFSVSEDLESHLEGLAGKEKLRRVIELTFHYFQSNTEIVRFMTALALQPDVMHLVKDKLKVQKEKNLDDYAKLFEELGYSDPLTEAYAFGALLDGTGMGFLAMEDDYPLDKMKEKILNKYQL